MKKIFEQLADGPCRKRLIVVLIRSSFSGEGYGVDSGMAGPYSDMFIDRSSAAHHFVCSKLGAGF